MVQCSLIQAGGLLRLLGLLGVLGLCSGRGPVSRAGGLRVCSLAVMDCEMYVSVGFVSRPGEAGPGLAAVQWRTGDESKCGEVTGNNGQNRFDKFTGVETRVCVKGTHNKTKTGRLHCYRHRRGEEREIVWAGDESKLTGGGCSGSGDSGVVRLGGRECVRR